MEVIQGSSVLAEPSSGLATATSRAASPRRHWTDWVGFAVFAALAGFLLLRSGRLGLFLLPIILPEALVAASFLVRKPAKATSRSLMARLVAYAGTFGLLVFLQVATRWSPQWLAPAANPVASKLGFLLWIMGALMAAWAVWHLRSAFSIVPQARTLVTAGPYRVARHPLYAAYIIEYLGLLLGHPTWAFAGAVAGVFTFLAVRIRYEEALLRQAFPAYAAYSEQVGALCPWPLRRPSPLRKAA